MTRASKGRTPLFWALSAAGALIVLAAIVEISVLAFVPMDVLVYRDSADPELRFELRPGAAGVKDGSWVAINSQGLRDDEVGPKQDGETRVAVVGGHETFGLGVEAEDTFVRWLGESLSAGRKAPVRTLNVSMHSYALPQKVRLACARAASLQADLVVLQLDDEDPVELPAARYRPSAFKTWLREKSAAVRLVAERRYWRRAEEELARSRAAAEAEEAAAPAPAAAAGTPAPGAPSLAAEESMVQDQLRKFKECLEQAGARGAVALIPNLSTPPGRELRRTAAFRKALAAEAKALKLPYLDAGPELRKLPASGVLKRPGEPVLSPAGHAAASQAFSRWLKPLLPKPRPAGRPSA